MFLVFTMYSEIFMVISTEIYSKYMKEKFCGSFNNNKSCTIFHRHIGSLVFYSVK